MRLICSILILMMILPLGFISSVWADPARKSDAQIRSEEETRALFDKKHETIAWAEGKQKRRDEDQKQVEKNRRAPKVTSANAKLLEDNGVNLVSYSWKVTVTNYSKSTWKVIIKIELTDAEGFVIESTRKYEVILDPNSETLVSDRSYMNRDLWKKYTTATGTIEYY